jgi:alpha-1,3-rhamnosyl/mannosyltransferase
MLVVLSVFTFRCDSPTSDIVGLKVLYNAIQLIPPLTGIGVYSKHLAEQMALQEGVEQVAFFRGGETGELDKLLAAEADTGTSVPSGSRLPLHKKVQHALLLRYSLSEILNGIYHYLPVLNGPVTVALEQLEERRRRESTRGYLYHETNFVLKPHRGPRVVTVHDLSVHHFPAYHPKERVEYMTRGMKRTMKCADQVVTVSEFVRRELIEHYGLDDSIVTAVPNAVDPAYQPRTEAQCTARLQKHGLSYRRYLLVVGSLEPRKNLGLLMDAYGDLPAETKSEFPLVHIGPAGWNNAEIQSKAENLHKSGWFRALGYVDQSELPYLLSGAAALAFPSIYEGFGLPALEAMASGVPLLTSNTSALPELVGDTGILVDPRSRSAINAGLVELLDRGERVESMVSAARLRAREFTWGRTARETYEVYLKAYH